MKAHTIAIVLALLTVSCGAAGLLSAMGSAALGVATYMEDSNDVDGGNGVTPDDGGKAAR